jgi:hypothetical protein
MPLNECDLPPESIYGTTVSGNLPVNKRNRDGVDIVKAGHCYKLCPYSTDNDNSDIVNKTDHTQTRGRMKTHSRGRSHGWMCWDDNCYYYTTEMPGRRFFEV